MCPCLGIIREDEGKYKGVNGGNKEEKSTKHRKVPESINGERNVCSTTESDEWKVNCSSYVRIRQKLRGFFDGRF